MSLINTPPALTGYSSDNWSSYLAYLLSGGGSLANTGTAGSVITASTSTTTNVASTTTASAGNLLAANASRLRYSVTNDSTAVAYVLEGAGVASATNYSYQLTPSGYVSTTEWVGPVSILWASANGNARVTEYGGGVTLSSTPIVPVAGTLVYAAAPAPVIVGTTSTLIVAAGTYLKSLTLLGDPAGASNVWLSVDGSAAVSKRGFCIEAGGGLVTFGGNSPLQIPAAAIYGIAESGTVGISLQGA